ncbi:MAG: GlxA family transcriptional regulator [Microthrixaceae bacterium]
MAEDERRVVLLCVDRLHLLDLGGPAEVFRAANLLGARPPYRNLVVTPDGGPVRADSGVQVGADASLTEVLAGTDPIDLFLVIGGIGIEAALGDDRLRSAVRELAGRARRIGSVCTGALLLADAGLLDGRRATTHWADTDRLAERHPEVTVEADHIYVRDGEVWTSAGVTTGIDLALALVEEDHGSDLAHAVAGWLVVFTRRPGGQSQFSAQLSARPARRGELRDLQRWLPDHLAEDLGVPALAARAGMSERTFARAFRAETGTTPAVYVESMRLEAARRLLETTDLTVAAVARETGFRSPERLHRAVRRHLGTTPDRYRQHFAHAPA